MKSIPDNKKKSIIAKLKSGMSIREVALQVGVGRTTVNKVSQESIPDRIFSKGGRPSKLSTIEKRFCVRQVTKNRVDNAVKVCKELENDLGVSVSEDTVRRALKNSGLKAKEKQKKPNLSQKNIKHRLAWAKKYKDYTVDDWRRVIWSDETKINRFNSDGRTWYWSRDNESLQSHQVSSTVKHGGGNVIVWSCITQKGVGYMCKIDNTMDKHLYKDILCDELEKTIKWFTRISHLNRKQLVFQHDNDPKHKSSLVKDYLNGQKYEVMDWPSQSPDLNPIEHIWALVKRRLNEYEEPPKGIRHLWERVAEVWHKQITVSDCLKVIDSMPSRCKAVIKAKGKWTKY